MGRLCLGSAAVCCSPRPLPHAWLVPSAELPDDGLHLETMSMPSGTEAKFIKLCIHSGHAEFAAVYNVSAF